MIERVISGGQTGSDQAGWRAARAAGIPTGGTMPWGFKTEDGPRPEFADLYGAVEHESAEYPPRTEANVRAADGTLVFGKPYTAGSRLTVDWCRRVNKTYVVVSGPETTVGQVRDWIRAHKIRVLNVAGNRASTTPGIGERVEAFLGHLFKLTQDEGR